MNVIKVFRELLAFLTVVPLGRTEDFVESSARNMWLFPVIGGLMGFLASAYFFAVRFILNYLLVAASFLVHISTGFLLAAIPPLMTLAFLLVLTGFQHFDGLIDLGNALGVKKLEDRREIAHRWTVTYKGALLGLFVEFAAAAGLFLMNLNIALRALILAEVCAKLAMVTIVWRGKAAHAGLGARFIAAAKKNLNIVAFAFSLIIGFVLLGALGDVVVLSAAAFGVLMERAANSMFGGVSGDMIGATNEAARALSLFLTAAFTVLASGLLWGAVLV